MELMLAVYNGDLVNTRRLLEAGMNPNIVDRLGQPLLFRPIISSLRENDEMVELLLTFGAHPEMESENGDTALFVASIFGHLKIIKLLLDQKININHQNKQNHTALFGAINHGRIEAVKFLLDHGAKINIFNNDGIYPLHIATHKKHIALIQILLEHGADPNVQDPKGKIPKEYIKLHNLMTPKKYKKYNDIIELFNSYQLPQIKEPDGS